MDLRSYAFECSIVVYTSCHYFGAYSRLAYFDGMVYSYYTETVRILFEWMQSTTVSTYCWAGSLLMVSLSSCYQI